MLRSIGAIVTGFLWIGIFSFAADAVMRMLFPNIVHAAGYTDSPPILLAIQLCVGIFAVSGCYLAARIAGRAPMQHALILGLLGLVFNILGTIRMWDALPAWYHVLALALVMPYAWAGGRIRELELESRGVVAQHA